MSNHLLSSTSYQPPAIKLNTNPQLQRTPAEIASSLVLLAMTWGWSLRAERGNLIIGGGIAWAEWVLCSGKVVLEIVSVDCVNLTTAMWS